MAKLSSKNQNYQFKLKFGTYTNLNMNILTGGIHFFCFRPETPFLGKFGPKNQNFQFNPNLGGFFRRSF